ncbi:hypothetical protein SAMN04489712_103110 [Thermomonospora echinospora]|uniref:Uncharacterized protein n=1 Tax=Thermomonospora echinospora TaxID=1992 RepID=A0A1H5X6I6_9ACTN|nr:hypothetical protein [Thermomonospora echinospora]SEG07351.1 hypothetical protein SAMN04489712_103110 [Thermomonospora echinospora]
MNKKWVKLSALAFAAWYVITRPVGAADAVSSAAGGLGNAAESVSTFFGAIL